MPWSSDGRRGRTPGARITEPQKHDGLEWRQLLDDPEAVVPYVRLALLEIAKGSIFSTFEMRE
jgi:hypothetical protein